ncbi:MAG: protein kinase [Clostridia bacterium]|nr:protein kinase [Clostridia bacterium]
MNIENYIESVYRKLSETGMKDDYIGLYSEVTHKKLREIFATLHYNLINSFETMNERLPTNEMGAHFWADPSRKLIKEIEIAFGLLNNLKQTAYAFEIDEYYHNLFIDCRKFLSKSGGSALPPYMPEVDLYYVVPIFILSTSISIPNKAMERFSELKQIGEGSYAIVYKYKDDFYNCDFVLKRAKKDLSDKELLRFKREFNEMQTLSSPYILEVYRYNDDKNEYIMEYMNCTLEEYIQKNNNQLSISQRKNIAQQILRAFDYIHSKGRLHRDISPRNILIKIYDDVPVVKIADFGLVKTPTSSLTTVNTEFKGYFNDPGLLTEGFNNYSILHETFALTRIIYFVLTGRTNTGDIKNEKLKEFVMKGLNPEKTKRFQSANEMLSAFKNI